MRIQHRRPLIAGLCLFFACVLTTGLPARAASMQPATPLPGQAVPQGAAPARERAQAALLGIPDLRARSYGGGAIRIGAITHEARATPPIASAIRPMACG